MMKKEAVNLTIFTIHTILAEKRILIIGDSRFLFKGQPNILSTKGEVYTFFENMDRIMSKLNSAF